MLNFKQTSLVEAMQYPLDVVSGLIPACKLTIAACQRHLNDLDRCKQFPESIRFNEKKARHVLNFMSACPHIKGKLAGQPIKIMPWQAWILVSIFGFEVNRDDTWGRKYRKVYIECPRKSAKSTISSGIALYALGFDNELGSNVYTAATTRDQARIVFDDARFMVEKSPLLRQLLKTSKPSIELKSDASSFMRPLSSDSNTLDGLNVFCSIIDEYHAHKTSEVYDVIESATGSRENPLIVAITTAGFNLDSPCYILRKQYIEPLLNGDIEDDSYFGVVYTIDDDDDPLDESSWVKANPAFGMSKSIHTVREEAAKAKVLNSAKVNFLTKHLNVWVNSSESWLNIDQWNNLPASLTDNELLGRECYIGVDLARKTDLTAVSVMFPLSDGTFDLRAYSFLPEDTVNHCSPVEKERYQRFINNNELILTEGNVVDDEYITDFIRQLATKYQVREIVFDSYGSTHAQIKLQQAGFNCIAVSQSTRTFSAPMVELEGFIADNRIRNPRNSCLTWQMSNVVLRYPDNKNCYPSKETPSNKIDSAVALFMACSRVLLNMSNGSVDGFLNNPIVINF